MTYVRFGGTSAPRLNAFVVHTQGAYTIPETFLLRNTLRCKSLSLKNYTDMMFPRPCRPCTQLGSDFYHRNGRIGCAIAVLGVLGIFVIALQLNDLLPRLGSVKILNQPSSFVDCRNGSLAVSVRTAENSWGAFDPVVESLTCPTLLASNVSSDPADWLKMCSENHDLYRQYMSTKTKNHLKGILASSETKLSMSGRFQLNTTASKRRPSFLIIGDSLDKFMAYHICNITGGVVTKVDPPKYKNRRPFVCSSPSLEIGFFNIFGMAKTCDNAGVAHFQDSRSYNSTVERVAALLPDVLRHFENKPQYVQIGSALWDLSHGCVGRNGVPESFREDYKNGMLKLYGYLTSQASGIQKDAGIYWRTSPPVRKSYSSKWERISLIPFDVGAHGRTRKNQWILNQVMHDTFSELDIGHGIMDWWQIAQGVSETFLNKELPDGRHYTFCSCLTFFNEWMDQIGLPWLA
jgi:hypothetical protein